MKKSDLFDIAIKLFGVYLILESLMYVKELLLMIHMQTAMPDRLKGMNDQYTAVYMYHVGHIGLNLLFGLALILGSGFITRKLIRSDSEPGVNFTLDKQAGIEIACVVVGGLMLTTALSTLGDLFISYVQSKRVEFSMPSNEVPKMFWQVFLIFLGYCLIAGHAWIGKHFTRKP
ncbi:MAG TPA: hypothetical protein VK826_07860 [Bacteroidia bacterium]|nr:hypothetical protein [Bacteroidia bacterium]